MKNRIQGLQTTTVCCVCGSHMSGPWPASQNLSHGYCKTHYHSAMKEIEAYLALLERQQLLSPQSLAA